MRTFHDVALKTDRIEALGRRPGDEAAQLASVGFVAQDAPVYGSLTVAEHLRLGQRLNPRWDQALATNRVSELNLALDQRAGRLSGGQRSQLALTIAMGKRPEPLLLDEPVSSVDPLARRQFLQDLMALVAEHRPTVMLSTHLLSDVERVCDHLIVLADGHVRVDGPVDQLLDTHKVLTGARRDVDGLPRSQEVIEVSHTDRQTTVLVRTTEPILDPRWAVSEVGLEELARPGEVLLTTTVQELLAGAGLAFEERGEHQLRGIKRRWCVAARIRQRPVPPWATLPDMGAEWEALQRVPLFADLSASDLAAITRPARSESAAAGDVLCQEGEPGYDFFVIVEGEATVDRGGRVLRRLGPGDYFGELALLDRGPRSATVTAATDMRLLRLAELDFSAVLDEVPALTHKLLAAVSRRLREAEARSDAVG